MDDRIPIRTDLTVLPGDPKGPKIGFTVQEYLGPELWKQLDAQEKPVPLKNREDIQPGDVVYAPWLWGQHVQMTVEGDEGGLYGRSGDLIAPLKFDVDDRHSWIVMGFVNTRGLKKLALTRE